MTERFDTLFGSKATKRVLLYLETYGEGYGREIARTFGIHPIQIQNQLKKLEGSGWLVSRPVGKTRLFTWNLRNPLVQPLRTFLHAAIAALPASEIRDCFRRRRPPPRSAGARWSS